MPVVSKAFPSVIAPSVCWSLQCLVSALTQRGRWRTLFFFFLGLLVQSRCGEGGREGCCKQITLACVRSASATLGLAPTHSACSLPAHTARALGCSAGNHPRPALGCLHFPGPSRSGSGTPVVLRGTDSRLGLHVVPFPDPSSSDDEVFGARDCCDLSPPRHSVI